LTACAWAASTALGCSAGDLKPCLRTVASVCYHGFATGSWPLWWVLPLLRMVLCCF
jgi:hypothetical protein